MLTLWIAADLREENTWNKNLNICVENGEMNYLT